MHHLIGYNMLYSTKIEQTIRNWAIPIHFSINGVDHFFFFFLHIFECLDIFAGKQDV